MDSDTLAELKIKTAQLATSVVDLDRRVTRLTTQVGELLGDVRRLRERGEVRNGHDG